MFPCHNVYIQVNQICIEMAREKGAMWIAMPCCIGSDQYLGNCSLKLQDELHNNSRYHVMCGAMAHRYEAQWMVEIDRHITNRNIILAAG